MIDFTSDFWHLFVAGATAIGLVACVVLLIVSGKTRVMSAHDNTTGHVWDGDLKEMNNPLPRWWVWLFVITIIFSVLYLVAYPGMGSFDGKLRWTSEGQYRAEVEKANRALVPVYARFAGKAAHELAADPQAMAIGERLFMNNCAQCHGSDAMGSRGFPNLTDGEWLWGGAPEQIRESIVKGRNGVMPPMGAAVGTPEDVKNLAHHVLSLSGSPHDSLRAQLGKAKWATCAACHGMDGKGNPALGAPDLTDKVWLHGSDENAIVSIIMDGRNNAMPPQGHYFTEAQVEVLTAYVWSLSHPAGAAGGKTR